MQFLGATRKSYNTLWSAVGHWATWAPRCCCGWTERTPPYGSNLSNPKPGHPRGGAELGMVGRGWTWLGNSG